MQLSNLNAHNNVLNGELPKSWGKMTKVSHCSECYNRWLVWCSCSMLFQVSTNLHEWLGAMGIIFGYRPGLHHHHHTAECIWWAYAWLVWSYDVHTSLATTPYQTLCRHSPGLLQLQFQDIDYYLCWQASQCWLLVNNVMLSFWSWWTMQLQRLDLSFNHLTGVLPESWSNLANVRHCPYSKQRMIVLRCCCCFTVQQVFKAEWMLWLR